MKHTRTNNEIVKSSYLTLRTGYDGSWINFLIAFHRRISWIWFQETNISRFYFVPNPSNLVKKVCGRTFHRLNSWIWSQENDFKGFFLEKRPCKLFRFMDSDSWIQIVIENLSDEITWIRTEVKSEDMCFLKSDSWIEPEESGQKIDPAIDFRETLSDAGVRNWSWFQWIRTCVLKIHFPFMEDSFVQII